MFFSGCRTCTSFSHEKETFKETLKHQKEKETASVHDLFTGKLVKRKRAKQAKQSFLFDIPFKVHR